MIESVIFARDNFLIEGGFILPDKARIYLAAIDDHVYKNNTDNFWEHNEYDISMKCAKDSMDKFVFVDEIQTD